MSHSTEFANAMLNHTFGVLPRSAVAATWVQLHYGNPGADGTANAWSAAGRVSAGDWETSEWGWVRNEDIIEFASLPDPGVNTTLTHVTIWDASTSGNCLHICSLSTMVLDPVDIETAGRFLIPPYYLVVQWVSP